MITLRQLLIIQGSYTLLTAVWPILHIESFLMVTGPKTDLWLVKTVGALLIPVAMLLLVQTRPMFFHYPSAIIIGAGTAIAFMAIDCYYVAARVIDGIYLVDAFFQLLFLAGWTISYVRPARRTI